MATPEAGMESMIKNLADKTGKTLDQWINIARKSKLEKHGQIVSLLKSEHGLTHGYANLVALRTLSGSAKTPESGDLLAAQYSGAKASMRPVYDALVAAIKKFGSDVDLSPKKTNVSLRRNKQFALVQPATTRVDVGINLKGAKPTARLEESGSFNAMVSHRVRLAKPSEVDAQLIGWLKQAYEMA